MNTPYIKQYDNNGELIDPITKNNPIVSLHPNRAARRKKVLRFYGNGKNCHLTVTKISKHKRVMQFILPKEGNKKTIYHYFE